MVDRRRFAWLFTALASVVTLTVAPVAAQSPAVAPAVASPQCAQPNVAGTTLVAAEPDTPALAAHYGLGGRVLVIVSLDASSRVVAARIYQSSNPIFDEPSLEAARASRFRTAVHDCVPFAGDYVFSVDYNVYTHPALVADPLRYFPGTWTCRDAATAATRTQRFRLIDGRLGAGDDRAARTIARDDFGGWSVREDDLEVGFALPWVDPSWVWMYRVRMADGSVREEYARIDKSAFERARSFEAAGVSVTRTERCTRTSTPPQS